MAKYRPAGKARKKGSARPAAAIPCVVLLLSLFALVMLLFYMVLKSSS